MPQRKQNPKKVRDTMRRTGARLSICLIQLSGMQSTRLWRKRGHGSSRNSYKGSMSQYYNQSRALKILKSIGHLMSE